RTALHILCLHDALPIFTTRIWAVDLDPHAVQLARHNTAEYNVSVLCADATDTASLVEADAKLVQWIGHFDAVVSNPPYIPTVTQIGRAHVCTPVTLRSR